MSDQNRFVIVKPWWQSKTMWGALIAGLAPIIGAIFHVSLSDIQIQQYGDAVAGIAAIVGAIIAAYGRMRASIPITQSVAIATIKQTAEIVEAAQEKKQ